MTVAGTRKPPATEPGLRPAPPRDTSPSRGRLLPILIILIGIFLGTLRLAAPSGDLYPIEGDSAKYHEIAAGFSRLISHPIEGMKLWFSRSAGEKDLAVYNFDSWVLQHAPAYTFLLGIAYLLPGDDAAAGRLVTVLLWVAGGLFLFLIARDFFGTPPALAAAGLYLFWPAHWAYAPAVLTEVPVAAAALFTVWIMLRTAASGRRGWIWGGVALGGLILTKTTLRFLALPWILFEFLLDRDGGTRAALRRAAWRTVGWGTTQLIWLIFLWGFQLPANPLASTGEDWLWIYRGNYVPDRGWESVGVGDAYTPELIEGAKLATEGTEGERKGAMYRHAFQKTLTSDPGGMAALFFAKIGIFWRFPAWKTDVGAGPISLPPPARLQPAVAVAALIGLAGMLRGPRRRFLPLLFPIYITLLHAATHLVSRYNVPAIPFAMLFAAGALGSGVARARSLLDRSRRSSALRGIVRPSPDEGPLQFAARWCVVLLPLALLWIGARANDPDPDQGRIRLRRPGDAVRLRLELPSDVTPGSFVSSEVLIDMLPSLRGRISGVVRVNGVDVGSFDGRPPSGAEAFLLDREVHEQDGRYRRVLRSADRLLDGNLRRRRGLSNAGYDLFRQWFRFPVDPGVAFAGTDLDLEIRIVSSSGGWLDLFVDREAPPSPSTSSVEVPARVIEMPAFFTNAYELSSYRFDALATDRVLADARLIRPIRVYSVRRGATRTGPDGERPIAGEPRIRLRGQIPGGYALVRSAGRVEPAWIEDPAQGLRRADARDIQLLQADRERYFDGRLTF